MKRLLLLWSFVLLVGLFTSGRVYRNVNASIHHWDQYSMLYARGEQADPTLIPTTSPVAIGEPAPETRVLPPVGTNAGLVIGASVLVLIIIGGVLSARLRVKH